MKRFLALGLLALSMNAFSQAENGIQNSGGRSCYNAQGNLCIPKPANSQGCANGQALIESKHCGRLISYCSIENKLACTESIGVVLQRLEITKF